MKQGGQQGRPRDLITAIEEGCEKAGDIKEVGPDHYRALLELTDIEMAEIIFDLVRHQSEYLKNRIAKEGEPSGVEFIKMMLRFVMSGFVAFDEYGRILFFKLVGPKPTSKMQGKLDVRIESLSPLTVC